MATKLIRCILHYALEKGPNRISGYLEDVSKSIYTIDDPKTVSLNIISKFLDEDYRVDVNEDMNLIHVLCTKDDACILIIIEVSRCKSGTTLEDSEDEFAFRKFQEFESSCWGFFDSVVDNKTFTNTWDLDDYFEQVAQEV